MKAELGDIFEINTTKGKVYLHYVFVDYTIGDLVRVLNGFYKSQPENLKETAEKKEQFILFFPISVAFKKKIIYKVGRYDMVFKMPSHMRASHTIRGEFLGWHIIDTQTWQRKLVKELTKDQKQLSPWGVWNYALLLERLEEGWNLEHWH